MSGHRQAQRPGTARVGLVPQNPSPVPITVHRPVTPASATNAQANQGAAPANSMVPASPAAPAIGSVANVPQPPPVAKQRPGRPKLGTSRAKPSPSVPKRAPANILKAGPTVPDPTVPTLLPPSSKPAGESQATTPTPGASQKRSRAPSTPSSGAEPQPKRQKAATGAAARNVLVAPTATVPNAAMPGIHQLELSRSIPPQSPSNVSKARSRKPSTKAKGAADPEQTASGVAAKRAGGQVTAANNASANIGGGATAASVVAAATAAAAAAAAAAATVAVTGGTSGVNTPAGPTSNVTSRRGGRTPTAGRSAPSPAVPSSNITIEGIPMPGNVKITALHRRHFGHEIQALMHAFGEVRYCARDVLEIVEDTVRERVRMVALQAAERSLELAEITGVAPPLKIVQNKTLLVITVPHVAHALRRNPRALQRLHKTLDSMQLSTNETHQGDQSKRKAKYQDLSWDFARELAAFPDAKGNKDPSQAEPLPHVDRLNFAQDALSACISRADLALKSSWTKNQFNEFNNCRSVSFVRHETRSKASPIRGKQRHVLFREWLDFDAKDEVFIPDDTLHALGHIAWEAVGVLTQSALLLRHFDEIAKGHGDPRAHEWSFGRHILAALCFGIATGVIIPVTEAHGVELRQELERWDFNSQPAPARWRGYGKMLSPCLLPMHIREAIRRMDRSPDLLWGYPASFDFANLR